MNELREAFAANLKFHRKKAGYTQKQLAAQLGYTEKAVSKWESGGTIPPAESLVELALLLQTSVDGLLAYSREPAYFLGIDGGATKTFFALCDSEGKLLRTACLGPCNPVDMGFEKAEAVLAEGIRMVCAHIPCSEISVFAGISGGNVGCNQTILTSFFRRFRFSKIGVENDAVNIVAAGLGDKDGIAVIMGTGSVAFTQIGGVLRQYGGFGYLFDDGGDGYNLGRDAIHAALYDETGGGKPTLLTALLQENMGSSVNEALAGLYEKGKRHIASFAPLVVDAHRRGDRVATGILEKNTQQIANLITAAMEAFSTAEEVPVVCVGGLTKAFDVLKPMLEARLPKKACLSVYPHEPVLGALRMAGAPVDTQFSNGIKR